tara:strand:+ start:1007 stop:1213 length:207 start_codon:yes stop_codon:yes gene_type:complete
LNKTLLNKLSFLKKKKINFNKPIIKELDSLEYLDFFSLLKENNINYEKMKINNKTSLNELMKLIKLKN